MHQLRSYESVRAPHNPAVRLTGLWRRSVCVFAALFGGLGLASPACDSATETPADAQMTPDTVGDDAADTAPWAPPAEGQAYPAVTISDCEGNAVDLDAWLGDHDVSFVTFGAGWCVACQEEAPIINSELVDGFAGRSVGVVQILVENQPGDPPPQSLCTEWKDELEARFTVLNDPGQATVPQHFGGAVAQLPLHYIVTRDKTIRMRKLGALPERHQDPGG